MFEVPFFGSFSAFVGPHFLLSPLADQFANLEVQDRHLEPRSYLKFHVAKLQESYSIRTEEIAVPRGKKCENGEFRRLPSHILKLKSKVPGNF